MRRITAAIAILIGCAVPVAADDWPARTITLVVPFPAGGPIDVVARILAPPLAERVGQQIVIENVGGAGGATGALRVARAAPDGYQVLLGNTGTHTFSQLLSRKPLYDAAADFTPITVIVENSKLLVTRRDFPAATLPQFVAYAKANERALHFGSAGTGSATHMACVLFNTAIGVATTHVPYRGTGPAMQDLIGGRIDYICDVISTALPLVRDGAIKPIVVLSPQRNRVLPQLPTAHEQGLPNFDADAWNAFFFPRGASAPVVRRLADATGEVLDLPWVRERLESLGLDVPPPDRRGPDHLAALVPRELTKWAAPVKASGAAPE